ncbi:MAG: Ig domain-containing protein [Acidobacteria bacterium]|nr:Ig domain-containing protein [Acidobacteriota bacterium]
MSRPEPLPLSLRITRACTLSAALILAACGGGGGGSSPAPQPVPTPTKVLQSIAVAPAAPSLNIGMTSDLTATASYSDGTSSAIDNSSVWVSSAPAVATVNDMGIVTALTAGSSTITVTKEGISGTAAVTVNASAVSLTGLSLNATTLLLFQGGATYDLTATANWSNGTSTVPYDSNVTWTSTNPSVASVNASGVVVPVAPGTANVTASASGHSATCNVTVQGSAPTLSSLSLSPATGSITVGQTLDLTATANWSNGTSTVPYDSNCVWASSSTGVATVNSSGVVTALAAGSTTITASAGGRTATCAVTVQSPAVTLSSLSLSPATGTLTGGQTLDITATANWSNGTSTVPYDSSCTWTSSSPAVATVNAGGVVTALAAGSTTITASASGRSATCAVTVQAPAVSLSSLTLNPTSGALTVGQTLDITATANWSNGTATSPYDSSCAWTSSNPGVASVNAGGVVSAVAAGTATITASAGGRSATCAITVTAPAPTFDSRLVGRWQWVGMINASTSVGSFYTFNANGTFTYSLIQQTSSGCIAYSQVVAYHEGTFSSVGSLDNPSSAGQIVMTCSTHHVDWTNCAGTSTTRTTAVDPNGNATPNPHFHWAAFINANTLATNHGDDYMATGTLNHARQ